METRHSNHHQGRDNDRRKALAQHGHIPTVEPSSGQEADLSTPSFKQALVAKVLGKRVESRRLSIRLHHLWRPEGRMEIVLLAGDFLLVKFFLLSDYNKVFASIPWTIDDHYIVLQQWFPNFNPSDAAITHVAVWVRLPKLPEECYEEETLLKIGKLIGEEVVKIDHHTKSRTKFQFARLCISIDLRNPVVPFIVIGGLLQRIQYEGLDLLCYQCGRYGHRQQHCLNFPSLHNPPSSQPEIPEELSFLEKTSLQRFPSLYGPWLQFRRRGNQHVMMRRTGTFHREEQVQQVQRGNNNTLRRPLDLQHGEGTSTSKSAENSLPAAVSLYSKSLPFQPTARTPSKPPLGFINELHQPQSPAAIELYSQVLQLSVEQFQIISPAVDLEKLIVERNNPKVVAIDSKIPRLDMEVNMSGFCYWNINRHNICFIPKMIDHTEYSIQKPPKKLLIWSCRGAGDARFLRTIKDLCRQHQPSIVLLLETRASASYGDQVAEEIGFPHPFVTDPEGFTGGIWLLWRKDDLEMRVYSAGPHHIHLGVEFPMPETLIFHAPDAGTEPQYSRVYGEDSED
ncbi:uncharacterized protein LOC127801418 isoform X2 [Diospyros lotus]|uniref:uncharacterized protein LOC127801418 isoform X2 n=1 Tax=Diospyros lotus TaxID=55363 RepID=UPI00225099B8|nr:uncharacterized protein LOC127801418 isoform X2 [Diospyros lotus]